MKSYPLFTGMTRPAFFLGVPLNFFVLVFFPCLCVFIISEQFTITLLAFCLCYAAGFMAALHDERFVDIGIGLLNIRCPNQSFWKCKSYDPS